MRTAARKIPPISPAVEARIWASIEKRPDGIWSWLRPRSDPHRAMIHISGRATFFVNRIMWVMRKRLTNPDYQIPDGLDVCHRNDVTPELYDCNPENLWLGTHKENMEDRERKGRGNQPSGDRNGSRVHPERLRRGDNHPFKLKPERAPRGERNAKAKLTWNQVVQIRATHVPGKISYAKMGRDFGVGPIAIKRIVTGISWRHPR